MEDILTSIGEVEEELAQAVTAEEKELLEQELLHLEHLLEKETIA